MMTIEIVEGKKTTTRKIPWGEMSVNEAVCWIEDLFYEDAENGRERSYYLFDRDGEEIAAFEF